VYRVVWYNDSNESYYVQVPSDGESYELNGTPLKPSEYAEFVHANGFLAVIKTEENLIEFLKENECRMIIN